MKCETCKWYKVISNDKWGKYGYCRRNAPIGEGFPKVQHDDFCPEYETEDAYPPQIDNWGWGTAR